MIGRLQMPYGDLELAAIEVVQVATKDDEIDQAGIASTSRWRFDRG
jgi:hypothetical protein